MANEKIIRKQITAFKKLKKPVFTLTLYDNDAIKTLSDELVKILKSG
jgi:hypothetical protein